jgi:hypothetical protein
VHELVEQKVDAQGQKRLTPQKSHNANTGVPSVMATEFSAIVWNRVTLEAKGLVKVKPQDAADELMDGSSG